MRQRLTADSETRLDKLLADKTPLSRNRARTLIAHGGVRVDGQVQKLPWHIVTPGAVIEVRTVNDPSKNPDIDVLFSDRWLMVINKPAGLPSQPGRDGGRMHVYGILSAREGYVGLHHRLDTPASGALLLTRDKSVNAAIAAAFQQHHIRREYIGVVVGDPGEAGVWDSPIDGEPARTQWRRVGHAEGMSVLELQLETGRTHQIRRQAADAGAPLLGDRRSGGAAGRAWPRLALHAFRLSLAHPATGEPLVVEAPAPDDLRELLARAGRPDSPAP